MTGDPMESTRARQCTARSKRSGERCRRAAMVGQSVCAMHGGKSPGAVEKAAERQAEQQATATVTALWAGLDKVEAVKDPIDLLARTAAVLEQATNQVGERVNKLEGRLGAGEHLTQLRAEVVLLEKLLGHLRAVARDLAALGIAERQVELAAGQADLVVAAFRAGLAAGGAVVVPDVRDEMLRAFLEALGQAPGVVAGEVAS